MTENVRKIFDMIGVEPNERFKIKEKNNNPDHLYYIDEKLSLRIDNDGWGTMYKTLDILNEIIEIVKIPKYEFTEEEKNALKGLKLLKFNYIARNQTGELMAYTDEPKKNYTLSIWQYIYGEMIYVNSNMFKSIKWEDSKPFKIPNIEDKPKYETDEKKIEEKMIGIYAQAKQRCNNLNCNECSWDCVNYMPCNEKMFIDELIANNFTFLKESSINNSEFPIEKFQDPEGSTLRK